MSISTMAEMRVWGNMNKRNILEFLEETAARYPDKTAMRGGDRIFSFASLEKKARAIGTALLKNGISKGAVAIISGKHPDTVCAFLGALYAGCFYVCIDPSFPDARILKICDICRASAVICDLESLERAELLRGRAEIFCFDAIKIPESDDSALRGVREMAIDTDIAYVTFTSGSTGEPRGVCTSHRAVIDYADALTSCLGFDSETVFGNQAPLYYDAPLKELLPMMAIGASVVFIPQELFKFPAKLCNFISEEGINTLCFAASALAGISALGALDVCDMSFLRTVCFGSEPFSAAEYKKWRTHCPSTRFINLYGPTEATGMSAYFVAERELSENEPIPIGKPFPNTDIFLLNEHGEPTRAGEAGEIYIRGSCLASGYLGGGGDAFVRSPIGGICPETVYRTGDLGMMNERGELVCLGRRDRQIKLMGRRIEPAEIEASARELRGVKETAVVFDSVGRRICLFYTGESDRHELIEFLSGKLPNFMLPRVCIRLESMPHMPNGKLDSKRLCELMTKTLIGENNAKADEDLNRIAQ